MIQTLIDSEENKQYSLVWKTLSSLTLERWHSYIIVRQTFLAPVIQAVSTEISDWLILWPIRGMLWPGRFNLREVSPPVPHWAGVKCLQRSLAQTFAATAQMRCYTATAAHSGELRTKSPLCSVLNSVLSAQLLINCNGALGMQNLDQLIGAFYSNNILCSRWTLELALVHLDPSYRCVALSHVYKFCRM